MAHRQQKHAGQEWHSITAGEAVSRLGSSASQGLPQAEAEARLKTHGYNEITEKKKHALLKIIVRQFVSLVVAILVVAAVISILVHEYLDAAVIIFVLLINAAVGTFQEWRAEKAVEALKRMSATSARVLRNGGQQKILARELVPGDIILLEVGDRVPADCRIMECFNFSVNESILTGEAVPVEKSALPVPERKSVPISDRTSMAFMQTVVTYGRAKAVVTGTGFGTEIGKIAEKLQEAKEEPTPLQNKISGFMKVLSAAVLALVAIIIALGVFASSLPFSDALLLAIAQAVSAIPEGLPIVITIVFAVGIQSMARKNAIIRKLASVETLGSTTVICSDKTGTLTKNEMTVREIYMPERLIEVSGSGYGLGGSFTERGKELRLPDEHLSRLLQTAVLCNDALLGQENEEPVGDPTEAALIVAAAKAGIEKKKTEEAYPRVDEIPFDSEKKYMATFNRIGDNDVASVKGALEQVLSMCDRMLADGKPEPLLAKHKKRIIEEHDRMTGSGLRVLAFAYGAGARKARLSGLVFVGMCGMLDPPRDEAREAVSLCKESGIKVVMITGDHRLTAVSVAKALGIWDNDSQVITGEELDAMSDSQLERMANNVSVYARTSAEHKTRVVHALQKNGHIVAMTGDGVNDALALKDADVGVSMGLRGTEVAKEASDIVLADDNFASIVAAIEEGRGVYLNIRKVMTYLLATNLGEVMVLFMILGSAFALGSPLPLALLPIHILWVNLVTDGVCDVTLAMEPKERNLMQYKPRKPTEGLISGEMKFFLVFSSLIMALGTFITFMYFLKNGSLAHARTATFTVLAFFQLFSALNFRSFHESLFSRGLFSNPYLVGAIAVSILMQASVIYTPWLNEAMKTTPLSLEDWAVILLVSSSVLVAVELKKFFFPSSGHASRKAAG